MMMMMTKSRLLLHFFFSYVSSISALDSDGTFLLSFKNSLLSHPSSLLQNWNHADATPCSWTGVTCAPEFGSATPRVISLVLPSSHLLGSIPKDLGLLQHLRSLDLSNNLLNGTLPTSLFNCSELQNLSLSSNHISGELPEVISGMQSLRFLTLSQNAFMGKLPESLAFLKNLTGVSLKNNYFSGGVPGGFDSVEVLDLSSNLFDGNLPLDFGGGRLNYLNLSNNKLSGSVFPEFARKIPANATMDLSFNNFSGQIPQTFSLSNQKTEYFAGNLDLCGKPLKKMCTFPSSLSKPPNVSSNGPADAAIAAIPKTAGAPAEAKNHGGLKGRPGKIAAIVVGDLAAMVLLAVLLSYAYQFRKKNTNQNPTAKAKEIGAVKIDESRCLSTACSCLYGVLGEETSEMATESDIDGDHHNSNHMIEAKDEENKKCLVMVDGETELEMETLLKASAYILGSSGKSIVYKAVLGGDACGSDGEVAFAVRRIGESGVQKMTEFENIVRVIAKLRHPNLVKVRGFYWGEDEKLVIYDYVSNGNLAGAAYKKIDSSSCYLPFKIRLKIAKGIAKGISYIHKKKYVHGNVKPSNILLTTEMDPVISDFGLEWLVSGNFKYKTNKSTRNFGSKRSTSSRQEMMIDHDFEVHTTGLHRCMLPYHAPESVKNLKPNPKWDVYSFGIILLELLSGRVFSYNDLVEWNTNSSNIENESKILKMIDGFLTTDVYDKKDRVVMCFKLGFSCASLVPQKRPSMKEAFQVLEKISCPSP